MSFVNENTINSKQKLWEQIQNAANFIRRQSNVYVDIRKSVIKKIKKCIEVGGDHIKNLL